MCGIIGQISSEVNVNQNWISDGLKLLAHRGPDGSGIYESPNKKVTFGHRRLSIIDLTSNASQPMTDESTGVTITFNGEIYNFIELRKRLISDGYMFKSKSDTEVLLKAYNKWGLELTNVLNGMYSFAVYDPNKNRVFFSRDRVGEKPLYYSLVNKTLKFSSELSPLINDKSFDVKIDRSSLDNYLSWGYVSNSSTMIKEINKLEPAHSLLFDLETSKLKKWRYWSLPNFDSSNCLKKDELIYKFENLMQDAVTKQLISDVPVGLLLSGGVDSSLVTAFASKNHSNIKTFNVSFPLHKKFDESNHARLISNHFGTDHTELQVNSITSDQIEKILFNIDEPMVDSSLIPTFLVSQLIKKHCTVAIGGDGADELFGGYSTHSRLLKLKKIQSFFPHIFRNGISKISNALLPTGFKGRNYLNFISIDFKNDLPITNYPFNNYDRAKLMSNHPNWIMISEEIRKKLIPDEKDLIQRVTRHDFNNYLPADILVKVDRASMLNSLEIRAPFLDYRIIEFAYRDIGSEFKTTMNQKKIFLKEICKKFFPKSFDFNRKQGFSIPLADWLINDDKIKDLVFDNLYNSDTFFNKEFVNKIYNGLKKGYSNSEKIFCLLQFEIWRKKNKIKF